MSSIAPVGVHSAAAHVHASEGPRLVVDVARRSEGGYVATLRSAVCFVNATSAGVVLQWRAGQPSPPPAASQQVPFLPSPLPRDSGSGEWAHVGTVPPRGTTWLPLLASVGAELRLIPHVPVRLEKLLGSQARELSVGMAK